MDKPSLEVVLPLSIEDYLNDFNTNESKEEFKKLLASANSTKSCPPAESREAAYENAGQYVVNHCDVLVAIWDGKAAAG